MDNILSIIFSFQLFLFRNIKKLDENKDEENWKIFSNVWNLNYNYHLIVISVLKHINIIINFNITKELLFCDDMTYDNWE